MGTHEDQKEMEKEVREALDGVKEYDIDSLSRAELGSEFSFSDVLPELRRITTALLRFENIDLTGVPTSKLGELRNCCQRTIQMMDEIKGYTVSRNNPTQMREQLFAKINSYYDEAMTELMGTYAFAFIDGPAIDDFRSQFETVLEEVRGVLQETATSRDEAQRMQADLKRMAEKGAISANATTFANEAKAHRWASFGWLVGIFLSIALTLGVAYRFLEYPVERPTSDVSSVATSGVPRAIYNSMGRLIIISLCSYLIVLASRNYRGQRHNQILNQHRANALSTFQSFVENTKDEKVKAAILLQAAQAAFTNRTTGYESTDEDKAPSTQIVDIIGRSANSG